MSSSVDLDRHLRIHLEKLECSFVDEWAGAGGEISTLTSSQCFEAIVRLLWSIRPSMKSRIPSFLLPPAATARYRIATLVCQIIKEVGVREKVESVALLYGSGKELSHLFIELLQLIPVDGSEAHVDDEQSFAAALLARSRADDEARWVPEFCRALRLKHDGRFWCPRQSEPELYPLWQRSEEVGGETPIDRRAVAAALYADELAVAEKSKSKTSAAQLAKPALPPKPKLSSVAPAEQAAAIDAEEGEKRAEREEAERTLRETSKLLLERREMEDRIRAKRVRMEERRRAVEAQLEGYNEKLMIILEDPEEARAKIERFLEDREERVSKLERKWQSVREEKRQAIDALRQQLKATASLDSARERLKRAEDERQRLEVAREAYQRRAQKLASRLARNVENEDGGAMQRVSRHLYVKRLVEVTANLKKQREQLANVWRETDMVMKDIKWAEQAGSRTFDILEETLYKKADQSPKDERLYKNFVTMYNKCQLIVQEAENVGVSKRRKEELLNAVEVANASAYLTRMSPMLEDLASIEEENRRLEELLAAA